MKWTCDKCGGENVLQEWSTMLLMNKEEGWEDGGDNCYDTDYYFCNDCDDDCSPMSSEINSLHEDFIE